MLPSLKDSEKKKKGKNTTGVVSPTILNKLVQKQSQGGGGNLFWN